jgi:hypothetical protein
VDTVNWSNSRDLRIIKGCAKDRVSPRRFLVFVVPRADDESPLLQILAHERNFDIAVRFYEHPGKNQGFLNNAEYIMTGGLSKFHSASLFLESCHIQNSYDGYLFLDGDLEFDATQLSFFLEMVAALRCDLAQPSVTRDSYCYWKMAYHQPGYVFRETSFVEVMAPYLSKLALSKAIPTFTKSISTYGLDLIWPTLVEGASIAVIDAFQIRHRERVDHTSGAFYRYLRSIGIDLHEEERLILAEYGVIPEHAHSKRGYFWRCKGPLSSRSKELVSVPLDGPEKRTERQFLIDFAMLRARWGPARSENAIAANIRPLLVGDQI